MSLQLSVVVRNARADAVESSIGASPICELRTGAPPASCLAAPSGSLLAQFQLPADWMNAASAGSKTKNGTWSFTGLAAGDIGHFRIYDTASPNNCHIQGTVTVTGGGGDMTVDNVSIGVGQNGSVNSFTLNEANA